MKYKYVCKVCYRGQIYECVRVLWFYFLFFFIIFF